MKTEMGACAKRKMCLLKVIFGGVSSQSTQGKPFVQLDLKYKIIAFSQ